jgi:Flp pilus assembly pilin Flp
MFRKLWKDDGGIVAMEYLFVATIIGLGVVVGLTAVNDGLNLELTELGNAICALSQSYYTDTEDLTGPGGNGGSFAWTQGSRTTDTPYLFNYEAYTTPTQFVNSSNVSDLP